MPGLVPRLAVLDDPAHLNAVMGSLLIHEVYTYWFGLSTLSHGQCYFVLSLLLSLMQPFLTHVTKLFT
jgi:hypothetical protein